MVAAHRLLLSVPTSSFEPGLVPVGSFGLGSVELPIPTSVP